MWIRLHWWKEFREDGLQNYGDLMSKYLVEKISGKKVVSTRSKYNKYCKIFSKHFYIVIGSIIGASNENAIVWGSGIISKDQNVKGGKFLAVRGPRTRSRLLSLNHDVPEIYGDPGLLLPLFYNPKVDKKYEIGIIPHFVDYDLVSNNYRIDKKMTMINLLTTNIEKTTDHILSCKKIVSSSLHGIIIAHAYGIPAIWVKFSDNLSGDDVKFYDYFDSVDIDFKEDDLATLSNFNNEKFYSLFSESRISLPLSKKILEIQKDLLESCPFN